MKVSEKIVIHLRVETNSFIRAKKHVGSDVFFNIKRIGSSFKHGAVARGLTFEEEKAYLPQLIGTNLDSKEWEAKTLEYWADINADVPPPNIEGKGGGLELEVGFEYPDEESARAGEKERKEEWSKHYQLVVKENVKEYQMKFDVRFKLGKPINLRDYIIYRYCLIYSKVANFPELVTSSPNIEFYMATSSHTEETMLVIAKHRKAAYARLIEIDDKDSVKTAILYLMKPQIDAIRSSTKQLYPVTSKENRDILLEKIASDYPEQFIFVSSDTSLMDKALIERFIVKGLLKRVEGTNTIIYGDNQRIGNSLEEAIAFLKTEINLPIMQELQEKLKISK